MSELELNQMHDWEDKCYEETMDKLTPEQRDWIIETMNDVTSGVYFAHWFTFVEILNANTAEDESKWLQEAGFCGTCAYFHREPRCQGGICGRVSNKPQVKINYGCEEYEVSKEYEDYWLQQEDSK